jgi:AraC-like DNA-binding protein
LTRLFQQEVGLTPKHFARVRRFLRVVQATRPQRTGQTQQRVNWARLAVDCGYYDQAHLINEFHAFAGVSPSAYLRARTADSLYTLPQAD